MKAVTRYRYGSYDRIGISNIEKPVCSGDNILVKVYATTVNRTDCAIQAARPFIMRFITGFFRPRQVIPGTDFAGTIEATGSGVSEFSAGDRVWGFNDVGLETQAEYASVSVRNAVLRIPDGISFETAAASCEGAHYAFNFMNKVKIKSGQKVIINGATGAIGSVLVQYMKYFGLSVTAVCRARHSDLMKSLGADKIIDYETKDFTKDDESYDFVFDAVGKSTFFHCRKLLKRNGVYISSELGPYSQNLFLALITPIIGRKKVVFPFPSNISRSLEFVRQLTEEGKIKPLIDRSFPMVEAREAYFYADSGQKVGNVILRIRKD